MRTGCWQRSAGSRRACPPASAHCAAASTGTTVTVSPSCASPTCWPAGTSRSCSTTSRRYFEAEHEDGLRKVGYSKERRVDPQIVAGLLAGRQGFPLEIGCFEGNKAEKHTILPVISQFRARHGTGNLAVVADAGMLSAANLAALDTAGCKFIVGSRLTKAPIDLESHFRWHGDYFGDGQVIDTVTPKTGRNGDNDPALLAEPVWDPQAHPTSWRAVWAYSRSRAVRDTKTLTAQENRARDVITGGKAARIPRFRS